MNDLSAAAEILRTRLIVIVRAGSASDATTAVSALALAQVRVAEISLATPGALSVLERCARDEAGELIIGAGTVRNVKDAGAAVEAGAGFLVSPGFDDRVADWAASNGVLHIPGVFTPTEVERALGAGASLLKLFPAGALGPGYVRDLLTPFPEAQLIPTGGVDEANASAFLAAGAVAVAVGSALINHISIQDPSRLGPALTRMRALTAV